MTINSDSHSKLLSTLTCQQALKKKSMKNEFKVFIDFNFDDTSGVRMQM